MKKHIGTYDCEAAGDHLKETKKSYGKRYCAYCGNRDRSILQEILDAGERETLGDGARAAELSELNALRAVVVAIMRTLPPEQLKRILEEI